MRNQIDLFFYKQLGSALKVADTFKVFRVQSCLMVAKSCKVALQFDQVTYVCEKYNNFQDSNSIFMISDFKIFPIMLLRQMNFGVLSVQQFTFTTEKKLHFSLICSFH